MLPAHPLSLPLHGYPAQQLSEVRADAIQFGVGALEHALRNEVDNTVASRAAFEQFRRCVMQMGLWDYIKDFFYKRRTKAIDSGRAGPLPYRVIRAGAGIFARAG